MPINVQFQRDRPEPWPVFKKRARHNWAKPLWAIEWFWDFAAFYLSNWSFLEALNYMSSLSVLVAVIFYFSGSDARTKQRHYQAWQVINSGQGRVDSGGRLDALEDLNKDKVPLIGVDISKAFLRGAHLDRAHLARSDLSAADLREADFRSADFSDGDVHDTSFRKANLSNTNFRQTDMKNADLWEANLTNADLSGATLDNVDLRGADLRNIQWKGILSIKKANIYNVKNPPEGFVEWAMKHGSVQIATDLS
jgi:hypothetical protein